MEGEDQAKYLIELMGYKKALKLAKQTLNTSNDLVQWHKWNSIIYRIKKLNTPHEGTDKK